MLLAVAVQSRLPAGLMAFGTPPDIALALAVAIGLLAGPVTGAAAGFVSAYLLAANTPYSPGSIYVSHILVGFLAGIPRARLYTDNPLVAPAVGILAGVVSPTIFYVISPRSPILWAQSAVAQAAYCLVLTPIWYVVLLGPARRWQIDDGSAG